MYGTTIRSFNENKDIRNKKTKKEKSNFRLDDNKKEKKKYRKKDIDTQYMKLDEALVLQSAKDGTLDNNFPELINFQHQLLNKTNQISTNPFEYLKKTVIAYPNPKAPEYTPYHTSDYTGLLFDGAL